MKRPRKRSLPPIQLDSPRDCEPVLSTCASCLEVAKCHSYQPSEMAEDTIRGVYSTYYGVIMRNSTHIAKENLKKGFYFLCPACV